MFDIYRVFVLNRYSYSIAIIPSKFSLYACCFIIVSYCKKVVLLNTIN